MSQGHLKVIEIGREGKFPQNAWCNLPTPNLLSGFKNTTHSPPMITVHQKRFAGALILQDFNTSNSQINFRLDVLHPN